MERILDLITYQPASQPANQTVVSPSRVFCFLLDSAPLQLATSPHTLTATGRRVRATAGSRCRSEVAARRASVPEILHRVVCGKFQFSASSVPVYSRTGKISLHPVLTFFFITLDNSLSRRLFSVSKFNMIKRWGLDRVSKKRRGNHSRNVTFWFSSFPSQEWTQRRRGAQNSGV